MKKRKNKQEEPTKSNLSEVVIAERKDGSKSLMENTASSSIASSNLQNNMVRFFWRERPEDLM